VQEAGQQRELHFIDQRLREIKANDSLFGGVTVILIVDPAQLPPVCGKSLWEDSTGAHVEDFAGYGLYQHLLLHGCETHREQETQL